MKQFDLSISIFRKKLYLIVWCISLLIGFSGFSLKAQTVKGTVKSASGEGIPGATVSIKGTPRGVSASKDGVFTIACTPKSILVFSSIGFITKEVLVGNKTSIDVVLEEFQSALDEVVVVGYGKQKKEGVVAAVTQATGKTLERAGGVSSIGAALTGNVPGLITSSGTGIPGGEDPQIIIRGISSPNNSAPLILVDGVERPMNSVDISSVDAVTVLKDASATAVFGSRGANGVILITTKRGKTGKATIRATVNTIMKSASKLPEKYDSYDGLTIRNQAIEYELAARPDGWRNFLPEAILQKYRNPANLAEAERYPNVNWEEALFRKNAISNNANINISGGTDFVKYFTSADVLHEADLFRVYDNNRGYKQGFEFDRLNVRSNLDFQLSPSTLFKTNISGSYGVRKTPWGFTGGGGQYGAWIDAYNAAPDAILPRYSDGSWGFYAPNEQKAENSARILGLGGVANTTTAQITTDFSLEQDLGRLIKGLKFTGNISFDNTFVESDRGINDLYNDAQLKWIDPETGIVTYKQAVDGVTGFDFQEGIRWSPAAGNIGASQRRLFYQFQLNYAKNLGGKHFLTAMGLMNRNVFANGSIVPTYREDWVFRTTYTFNNKYTIEYNGAYNGSEQFASDYRFNYFSSGGVNWILSNEKFIKSIRAIDLLKLRFSYGQTGFDNLGIRWPYLDQWAFERLARLGTTGEAAEQSPYRQYRQTGVGNPTVQWEESEKFNVGVDVELLKGLIKAKADVFSDNRTKILLGNRQDVPSYYGAAPPVANLGQVKSSGYELELHISKTLGKFRLWTDLNMTHTQNKIIEAANPELLPDYQKTEGKAINQEYSYVSEGKYNTWDQLYGSTIHNAQDNQKLPGNLYIVDYNGDGVIDAQDRVPFGYTNWPQNTYNATFGLDWKGFTAFVQFYAVNNVSRQVGFASLVNQKNTVYKEGEYWSPSNAEGIPIPRWSSTPADYYRGTQYLFDGSYVRLKNAEIAYSLTSGASRKLGLAGLRIYLNGNNLIAWSKMPDDREANFGGAQFSQQGAYPTVRRYNLGLNITF
ncbi:SusC/RagA family TonB-linked outer membrane protein [Arcicella rosea]|uniref:TonB-linked SusC/RagA family outer membrane protein n=1 Tax=Arcicella rosea TaxID=502909 RepID=A0A841ES21_9BACT|nr:SusC/RagA family TonB-linked outer membrane protein [Arcicella rosea]MBB6003478.1 TonB-linked SusC/RagA family outer membrane protein [Arcicella rosea]